MTGLSTGVVIVDEVQLNQDLNQDLYKYGEGYLLAGLHASAGQRRRLTASVQFHIKEQ
jgi:hypothetical protein